MPRMNHVCLVMLVMLVMLAWREQTPGFIRVILVCQAVFHLQLQGCASTSSDRRGFPSGVVLSSHWRA